MMPRRSEMSISDKLVVIGGIFTGVWLVVIYGNIFPIKISFDGLVGQLWTAWIIISDLMLVIGIIIKIINR